MESPLTDSYAIMQIEFLTWVTRTELVLDSMVKVVRRIVLNRLAAMLSPSKRAGKFSIRAKCDQKVTSPILRMCM